jgi:hypothetical protein
MRRARLVIWLGLDVFQRVELRGVGRQLLHSEPLGLRLEVLPDQLAAMYRQVVPHQDDPVADMASQGLQEPDDFLPVDGVRSQAQEQSHLSATRMSTESTHGREAAPGDVFVQHRRLPFAAPRATHAGTLREATLIRGTRPNTPELRTRMNPS